MVREFVDKSAALTTGLKINEDVFWDRVLDVGGCTSLGKFRLCAAWVQFVTARSLDWDAMEARAAMANAMRAHLLAQAKNTPSFLRVLCPPGYENEDFIKQRLRSLLRGESVTVLLNARILFYEEQHEGDDVQFIPGSDAPSAPNVVGAPEPNEKRILESDVLFVQGPGPLQPREVWRYMNTWIADAMTAGSAGDDANAWMDERTTTTVEKFTLRFTAGREELLRAVNSLALDFEDLVPLTEGRAERH